MKTIDLTEMLKNILTAEEMKILLKCTSAREIQEKVTAPKIQAINEYTGQENDSLYFAYACEYWLRQQGY